MNDREIIEFMRRCLNEKIKVYDQIGETKQRNVLQAVLIELNQIDREPLRFISV